MNVGSVTVDVKADTSGCHEQLRKALGDMVPILLCDALTAIRGQRGGCVPDFRNGTPDEIWDAALDAAISVVTKAAHGQPNLA